MAASKDIQYYYFTGLPFGLAGRGGAARFALLDMGMNVTELEGVPFGEAWPKKKEELVNSNLPNYLPYAIYEGTQLFEHVAIARLGARVTGSYGKDVKKDAVADFYGDFYATWRGQWAEAAFGGEEKKKDYNENHRHRFYKFFEGHFAGKFLTGDQPTFCDYLVFSLSRDDQITFGNVLDKYPKLDALFKDLSSRPKIKAWIENAEKK